MSKRKQRAETLTAAAPDETVKTVEMMGFVTNCKRLNLRTEPNENAEVRLILQEGEEVMVAGEANEKFYSVCTAAGVEGYCMKDYIDIKLLYKPQGVSDSGEHTGIN